MVTIKTYLDESAGEHPFLAAGWAGTPEHWEPVCKKWQSVLDTDPKIKYFKMNDALGLKNQFNGWTEDERDQKLIKLAQVIPHDGTIFGQGCHGKRQDFEKVKDKIPRKILREPYYFCVLTTMMYSSVANIGS
jgi:hypothetical protein